MARSIASWLKEMLDSIDGDERFLMTLGAGMVNAALRVGDFISGEIYRDLTLGTVAVFITGSAYTTAVQMKQKANMAIAESTGDAPGDGK